MRNEYSQVHDLPDGYVEARYTYEVVPVFEIGRVAIYLVTFVGLFLVVGNLLRLI